MPLSFDFLTQLLRNLVKTHYVLNFFLFTLNLIIISYLTSSTKIHLAVLLYRMSRKTYIHLKNTLYGK